MNSWDGSDQDIQDILTELRRLFLSYRAEEIHYRYLINVIELLIQSARTRIIILRLPAEPIPELSDEQAQRLVIFSTFRDPKYFKLFRQKLSNTLLSQGTSWLETNLFKLQGEVDAVHLYIGFARVYPEDSTLVIGRNDSEESYRRMDALLQMIKHQEPNLLLQIHHCLNAIKPDTQAAISKPHTNYHFPQNIRTAYFQDRYLHPILEWVQAIYTECSQTPLLQIQNPTDITQKQAVNFSNLFFFIRMNESTPAESGENVQPTVQSPDDNFSIRLLLPKAQREELSLYYHENRAHTCQWHQPHETCSVPGIKQCLLAASWRTLPPDENRIDRIYTHYHPLWEAASKESNGTLTRAVFRNGSIVFDRRPPHSPINNDSRADQLMSCIKHRLLPANISQRLNPDDKRPQVIFVPVYGASNPLLLVAMVINAQQQSAWVRSRSEWQRTFHFAEMVNQRISSRFQDRVRKAYLGLAADAVLKGFESSSKLHAASRSKCRDDFEDQVNRTFDILSIIYPLPKLSLHAGSIHVINKDIRDALEVPQCGYFYLKISLNPHWQSSVDGCFFTQQEVIRKFRTAIARSIATEEKEVRDKHAFRQWHIAQGWGVPLLLKEDWRDWAKELGWHESTDD